MILRRKHTKNSTTLDNKKIEDIEVVNDYKFLGVVINKRFSPASFLGRIKSKTFYVYSKIIPFLKAGPLKLKFNLYKTLIEPHFRT